MRANFISNWLLNQWTHLSAPDVLLSLTVGQPPNLSALKHLAAHRVIFVEPDWEILAQLRKASPEASPWELIPLAAGRFSGESKLNKYNFHRLTSLKQCSVSENELPGLKKTGTDKVSMVKASDLVPELNIDASGENWLLIDAPGSEWDIIGSLRQDRLLHLFSRLLFTAGRKILFEDSRSAEAILTILAEEGYMQESVEDDADPNWPRFHLRLNRELLENRELRREVRELSETATANELEHSRFLQELHAKEESLKAAQHQLEQESQRFVELNEKLSDLEKEKQVANQQFLDREQALNTTAKEKKKLAQELEDKLQELDAQSATLKERNEQLLSDLSMAVKLQALREADLRDLQERYAKIREDNRQQVELLGKLRQRLGAASKYLQQFSLQESDTPREELAFNLVKALSGEDGQE